MSTQNQMVIIPTSPALVSALEAVNQRNKLFAEMFASVNFKQIRAMHEAVQAATAPLLEIQNTIKLVADAMSKQLNDVAKMATLVKFNFDFYAQPARATERVVAVESTYTVLPRSDALLSVRFDEHGFVWLNNQKIVRANARSSRHGQLLRLFEENKGSLVTDSQIKERLKVVNPKQVLKDLKSELRRLGYDIKYTPLPRQGRVYDGVIKKQ